MENKSNIVSAGLIGLLHEMNNPLTSIQLCLELMPSASEETKQEYYAIMKKSTDQLQHAIHEISDSFIKDGFYVDYDDSQEMSLSNFL